MLYTCLILSPAATLLCGRDFVQSTAEKWDRSIITYFLLFRWKEEAIIVGRTERQTACVAACSWGCSISTKHWARVLNQPRETLSTSAALIRSFSLLAVGFLRLPGWTKHWLLWPVPGWWLQKVSLKDSTLSYSEGEILLSCLAKHNRQNGADFEGMIWRAPEGSGDHEQSDGARSVIPWHSRKVGECT